MLLDKSRLATMQGGHFTNSPPKEKCIEAFTACKTAFTQQRQQYQRSSSTKASKKPDHAMKDVSGLKHKTCISISHLHITMHTTNNSTCIQHQRQLFGWWNLVGLTSAGICATAGSHVCMVRTLYPLLQLRDLHALFADLSSFLRCQEHVVRLVVVPATHSLPGKWWSAGGHIPIVVHDLAVQQSDVGREPSVPCLQGALLVLLRQRQFRQEVISDFLHISGLIIDGPHFIVFLRAVEVRDESSVGVDPQALQGFGRVFIDHVGLPAPKVSYLGDGPAMPDVS